MEVIIYCVMIALAISCFVISIIQTFVSKSRNASTKRRMTRQKLNEHKENMDKITERLGGRRDDIWQDRFIYDIAVAISDILIEIERSKKDGKLF